MHPKFITAAEAAQLKGVSREAIYAAIRTGRLGAQRVLGRLALDKAEVAAWTPTPHSGRRKGTPVSEETKLRIGARQRERWAERKKRGRDEGAGET